MESILRFLPRNWMRGVALGLSLSILCAAIVWATSWLAWFLRSYYRAWHHGHLQHTWIGYHLPFVRGVIAAAAIFVALVAIWTIPKWQATRSEGANSRNRFERENEARKTLAQVLGGIFVLAGLYSALQAAKLQTEALSLQREGQIAERYTKAIDQLGSVLPGTTERTGDSPNPNLTVRLGGIYGLEKISREYPRDYRSTVFEVLSAYVRENARLSGPRKHKESIAPRPGPSTTSVNGPELDQHPRSDIQAILTVIGRRRIYNASPMESVDLHETNLNGANLEGARLDNAELSRVQLERGSLSHAILGHANLVGGNLRKAHLEGAKLWLSNLRGADLSGARFDFAVLWASHLEMADLKRAVFYEADLEDADLDGADLRGADLSGAKGLTSRQLKDARGDASTRVPDGLSAPRQWSAIEPIGPPAGKGK
jgi:hypothetical protein